MYFGSSSGYSGIELTILGKCILALFVLFALLGIGWSLYVIWLFFSVHIKWVG